MNNEEVSVKVFNATFNNISVISWRSFSLVEETRVPGENQRSVASHWQTHHIMVYPVHLAWAGIELTTLGVIGTDCIGSYNSNYHTGTTDREINNSSKIRRNIGSYSNNIHDRSLYWLGTGILI
jgi:hypothetical protein